MDEQKLEALVTAFLAPLRDVGELLARQIDETNARCAKLELSVATLTKRADRLEQA